MYKIYEIRCNETDEVYIGKTIQTLKERLNKHRFNNNTTNSKQIILRGDYIMSQIDECDTEEVSILLEAYYIRNTDNCVNRFVPGRTKKEYYEENKDKILEYAKEYREVHKDKILEYGKEYRKENREYFLEYLNKYYKENREYFKEKKKEKYTCECDSILTIHHKARHEKSQKHQNFINSK